MTRLTFVGDIALDKPLLKAAGDRGNGNFDFDGVFQTGNVFAGSDLVVGNLETCFGGGDRYNYKPYHYNSPDSFCNAIKNAGIDLVSTANNHCFDEREEGLKRTLDVLDSCGIEHTGTFTGDKRKRYLIKDVNGMKVAFYSLTYSVNGCLEAHACPDLYKYVNLTGFSRNTQPAFIRYLKLAIKPSVYRYFKKITGKSTISAHTDYFVKEKINKVWFADIENQIKSAREESDLLIILLHSGGQFNIEPGEFSKFMMDRLFALGADIVIGNHSHTVQRIEKREGKIAAYSLGGYCMSVSGEYLVHDCLPEYSLALHVDVDDNKELSCSVSVLKGTEEQDAYLHVTEAEGCDVDKILDRCGIKTIN